MYPDLCLLPCCRCLLHRMELSAEAISEALVTAGLSDFVIPDKRSDFDTYVRQHVQTPAELSAQAASLAISFNDSLLAPVTAFTATDAAQPGGQPSSTGANIVLPYSIPNYNQVKLLHPPGYYGTPAALNTVLDLYTGINPQATERCVDIALHRYHQRAGNIMAQQMAVQTLSSCTRASANSLMTWLCLGHHVPRSCCPQYTLHLLSLWSSRTLCMMLQALQLLLML